MPPATSLITHLHEDVAEAKNNLLQAKVFQAYYANRNRSSDYPFKIGDKVMLLSLHHYCKFKRKGSKELLSFSLVTMALIILLMLTCKLLITH